MEDLGLARAVTKPPQPLFTLFVPTYNRKHLLPRLLESVEAQTFQDFELLIVDDGSQDGTYDFLCSYQSRGAFQMRMFYQENQGRHIAFNKAFEEARGFLFTTINSDDTLPPNAMERFAYWWEYAQKHYTDVPVVGVEALCANMETGEIVGSSFPESPMVADRVEIRFQHKCRGDKVRAILTSVIRNYRFPQIEGERYLSPSYLWHRLGFDRHKLLCVNEVLCYKEYLEDGITKNRIRILHRNPRGIELHCRTFVELAYEDGRIPTGELTERTAEWVRFALYSQPLGTVLHNTWRKSRSKVIWLRAFPRGVWRWRRDQRILSKIAPKS
jgi:glycosyltransferase involved in cell wall biosynthesis